MAAYAARLVIACYILLSHFFVTILAPYLRRNYDDAMAVHLCDESSSSSDSSDEDMLHESFVDAMFPNHKLEDLNESQCEAMFRLLTL